MVSLRFRISGRTLQRHFDFRTEEDICHEEDGQDGVVLRARKPEVLRHSLYLSDLNILSEEPRDLTSIFALPIFARSIYDSTVVRQISRCSTMSMGRDWGAYGRESTELG